MKNPLLAIQPHNLRRQGAFSGGCGWRRYGMRGLDTWRELQRRGEITEKPAALWAAV